MDLCSATDQRVKEHPAVQQLKGWSVVCRAAVQLAEEAVEGAGGGVGHLPRGLEAAPAPLPHVLPGHTLPAPVHACKSLLNPPPPLAPLGLILSPPLPLSSFCPKAFVVTQHTLACTSFASLLD